MSVHHTDKFLTETVISDKKPAKTKDSNKLVIEFSSEHVIAITMPSNNMTLSVFQQSQLYKTLTSVTSQDGLWMPSAQFLTAFSRTHTDSIFCKINLQAFSSNQ